MFSKVVFSLLFDAALASFVPGKNCGITTQIKHVKANVEGSSCVIVSGGESQESLVEIGETGKQAKSFQVRIVQQNNVSLGLPRLDKVIKLLVIK